MAKTVILYLTRKQSQVRLDVVQYTTAPDIVFIIEDYTPTGRADFYIEKPSGEEIYNHCTIDGNKVIFTPTTQCFAEVGEQKAQLQLLDGDKMAVSFPIQLVVAENIIDSSAAESQSEFTELQAAISTIGQYDQRIQGVQDAMDALETELTDDMAALQSNVTQQLNDAIAGVNTQINNVNTEMDALENRVISLEDYGFIYRRQLTSSDDLNNITTPGVYWYPTESVPNNAPFENAAVVEVFYAGSTTNRVIQRATRWAVRGQSKFRSLYGGNWINWEQYAINSDLTRVENTANTAFDKATAAVAKTMHLNFSNEALDLVMGTGNETATLYLWGNSSNLVGIGAHSGEGRVNLLARRNSLLLAPQTGNAYWELAGLNGNHRIGYVPGDNVTITSIVCSGLITNSSKTIRFLLPLPAAILGNANITNIQITARGVGGYLYGKADATGYISLGPSLMGPEQFSPTPNITYSWKSRQLLQVSWAFNDALQTNSMAVAPNNTPVTVECAIDMEVTN